MRGDGGVTGEGRFAGVAKFHSWGKYNMPLTQIDSVCPALLLACEIY